MRVHKSRQRVARLFVDSNSRTNVNGLSTQSNTTGKCSLTVLPLFPTVLMTDGIKSRPSVVTDQSWKGRKTLTLSSLPTEIERKESIYSPSARANGAELTSGFQWPSTKTILDWTCLEPGWWCAESLIEDNGQLEKLKRGWIGFIHNCQYFGMKGNNLPGTEIWKTLPTVCKC